MNILIVDDEENIRSSLKKYLSLESIGAQTAADAESAQRMLSESSYDAVVLDLKLPGMSGQELLEWMVRDGIRAPAIMISAHGEIPDAVAALKAGAADYLTKPFDPAELVHKLQQVVSGRKSEDLVEAEKRTSGDGFKLVGESPAMRRLLAFIERVADTDATVLITGESGTGKEVVAREIHRRGRHAADPFVAVNIGGIHETLMESELFGHEKGSFTGAVGRKTGLFELAGSGTLFLDEIGEMPMNLQVKLLRVLQERKIRRLGGTSDLPVNARIISATNRDVEAMVRDGSFREDLYYRLNVVRVDIPPLRERAEDIPLIARYLLEKKAARMGKGRRLLSPAALEALRAYPFPGNIRELENILERALIYSPDAEIGVDDIDLRRPAPVRASDAPAPSRAQAESARGYAKGGVPDSGASPRKTLDDTERAAIAAALERSGGNRTHAAQELGISRRTIINKIRQYGL